MNASHAPTTLSIVVGFFLAARVLFSLFVVHLFGASAQAGSVARLFTGFFLLLLALWSRPAGFEGRADLLSLSPLRWLLAWFALSLFSFLWTDAASPVASFLYWCGTLTDVLTILLLLRSPRAEPSAQNLLRGFIAGACLVALVGWLMPTQYDLRLGDEELLNSNTIGNLAAIAVLFIQYLARAQTEYSARLTAVFLSITVLRSLSKTTLVAFLVAQSFILLRDRSLKRSQKWIILAGGAVALVCFWSLLTAYADFYTTYGNQSVTLTGRTAIWAYVIDHGLERPWLGHGFDSMWKTVPLFGTFEARHAENEILQQFYSFGVAGVAILIGIYSSLWRILRRHTSDSGRVVCFSVLMYTLVRGFAEAEPFDLLLPAWSVTLLCIITASGSATVNSATRRLSFHCQNNSFLQALAPFGGDDT